MPWWVWLIMWLVTLGPFGAQGAYATNAKIFGTIAVLCLGYLHFFATGFVTVALTTIGWLVFLGFALMNTLNDRSNEAIINEGMQAERNRDRFRQQQEAKRQEQQAKQRAEAAYQQGKTDGWNAGMGDALNLLGEEDDEDVY